jgi:hypothetical protein
MTAYRPRWRTDATAFAARFAGQWAAPYSWLDRDALVALVRAMPNGDQIEIVEVPA